MKAVFRLPLIFTLVFLSLMLSGCLSLIVGAGAAPIIEEVLCQHADSDCDMLCDECDKEMELPEETFLGKAIDSETIKITGIGTITATNIVIPEYVNGRKVTEIGSEAFAQSEITSLAVPATVQVIGRSAFYKCEKLTSVSIDGVIEDVRGSAFAGCVGLSDSSFVKQISKIDDGAFSGCGFVGELQLGEHTSYIGSEAFSDCVFLTSVTVPDGVKTVGLGAFSDCVSIERMSVLFIGSQAGDHTAFFSQIFGANNHYETLFVVPAALKSVEVRGNALTAQAFNNCSSITEVILSKDLASIPPSSFKGCASLKDVEIPESVTVIGNSAFYGCSSIVDITVSDNVVSLGSWAFRECTSLRRIKIGSSINSLGEWVLRGCTSLESIEIPQNIKSIGDGAFKECSSLSEIFLTRSLLSVGDGAFYGCAAEKIYYTGIEGEWFVIEWGIDNDCVKYGNVKFSYVPLN